MKFKELYHERTIVFVDEDTQDQIIFVNRMGEYWDATVSLNKSYRLSNTIGIDDHVIILLTDSRPEEIIGYTRWTVKPDNAERLLKAVHKIVRQ